MKLYETDAWSQMMSGEPYDALNPELVKELVRIRRLIKQYNDTDPGDTIALDKMIRVLLGSCGSKITVNQPFRCDYGANIHVGENFFANFNLTILDEARVTIGDNAFLGPNVSIYTACHPLDPAERNKGIEWSLPVTIGHNCWIGGDVTILPGVKIGDNVTIGAGSVVTKDIPSDEVWAGNPATFIKKISKPQSMSTMLKDGLTHTSTLLVTTGDTALSMGSGDLPVLATPRLVALMENAAMLSVAQELPEGETTVGGHIHLSHLAPSPVGSKVVATAKLTKIEGRKLHFDIVAIQGDKTVGEATHIRFIVNREKFSNKAMEKPLISKTTYK